MISTIILWIIGLIVLHRLAVLIFWCAAYIAIQPIRFVLWMLGAILAPRALCSVQKPT
jgi:hypothetical protein